MSNMRMWSLNVAIKESVQPKKKKKNIFSPISNVDNFIGSDLRYLFCGLHKSSGTLFLERDVNFIATDKMP